jgi:hypothetical protein
MNAPKQPLKKENPIRSKENFHNSLQIGIAETTAAFPLNKAHDFVVTFRLKSRRSISSSRADDR